MSWFSAVLASFEALYTVNAIESKAQQQRAATANYWNHYYNILQQEMLYTEQIKSIKNQPESKGRCTSCGSSEFKSHQGLIICTYCRGAV